MVTIGHTSLNSNILSLGAILGSSGQKTLIDNINERACVGSYFGSNLDPFRTGFTHFQTTVLQPLAETRLRLANTASKYFNPEVIRPITSIADLERGITRAMMLPIIYYQPIRQQLENESIHGFGIDPSTLQEGDPYEHLLSNGRRTYTAEDVKQSKGNMEFTWKWMTVDPILTDGEVEDIRKTREFIDEFLTNPDTRDLDFTDFPRLRH